MATHALDSRKKTFSVTSWLQMPRTANKRENRLNQYLQQDAEGLEAEFAEEVSAPLLTNSNGVEMTSIRDEEALPRAVPVTKDVTPDFSILCPSAAPILPVAPSFLYPSIPESVVPPPLSGGVACVKGDTSDVSVSSGATKPTVTTSEPKEEEDLIINQANEQPKSYEIRDYKCDDYKSDYGDGGYQISSYNSVYE